MTPAKEPGPALGLSKRLFRQYSKKPATLVGTRWLWIANLHRMASRVIIEVVHTEGSDVLVVTDYAEVMSTRWVPIQMLLSEFGAFYYLGTREELAWAVTGGWGRVKGGGHHAAILSIQGDQVELATFEEWQQSPPESGGTMRLLDFLNHFEGGSLAQARTDYESRQPENTGDGQTAPEEETPVARVEESEPLNEARPRFDRSPPEVGDP